MAFDALITATEVHAEGIKLFLGPQPAQDSCTPDGDPCRNPASTPGQPWVVLVNPRWTPYVGDILWGGSDSACIESGGISFPYHRRGCRLYENWGVAA